MSGEDLKKKLESAGISQAEIARRLGVIPQSVGQSLSAKDVKSGFIESICREFGLDAGFFYGGNVQSSDNGVKEMKILNEKISSLQEENQKLKDELIRMNDPDLKNKESEIYRLWMKQMEITERMQELYQSQKEG